MFWGFFNSVGKTFRLVPQGNGIKKLPALCCRKSSQYPNRISDRAQVFPVMSILLSQLLAGNVPNSEDGTMFPIFSIITPEFTKPNSPELPKYFHLVCNSNIKICPVDSEKSALASEYWRNVQPMIICQNRVGYYLGKYDDPYRVTFELCPENLAEGVIQEVDQSSKTEFGYGYGNISHNSGQICISFRPTCIFIRRVSKFS